MNSSFLQAGEYQNKEERSNETQKNSLGQDRRKEPIYRVQSLIGQVKAM